ncbi:helix-turn-helix domain-containing protein [Brevundimonas sp. NPDC090276]|uniref:helix-turn-helix domain-containing protein n=1 Tax=Brevundimonas sp. NPDC090276 TaxID=3363956 RepID=UPI003839E479
MYDNPARPGAKTARNRRPAASEVAEIFEADYLGYQYRLVEFLAEHLADVSRTFNGDMHAPVILANIGQVSLQATTAARDSGGDLKDTPAERRGMTACRLADVTGIPRETVRRKLVAMAERGWIERQDGYWVLTLAGDEAKVRQDIMPLDRRSLQRAARLYCQLDEVVRGANIQK